MLTRVVHGHHFAYPEVGKKDVPLGKFVALAATFATWPALLRVRRDSSRLVTEGQGGGLIGMPPPDGQGPMAPITQAALTAIATALIATYDRGGNGALEAGDLYHLLLTYARLEEPMRRWLEAEGNAEARAIEGDLQISRSMHLHASSHVDWSACIPRALVIYQLGVGARSPDPAHELSAALTRLIGVEPLTYVRTAMAVSVHARHANGAINAPELARTLRQHPFFRDVKEDFLARYLAATARPAKMLADAATKRWTGLEEREPGLGKYAGSPLLAWPIVELPEGTMVDGAAQTHVEPIEWIAMERASTGLYFRIMDERDGALEDALGKSFEDYVGHLLRQCLPAGTVVLPEEAYTVDGAPLKTTDWIVVEEGGVTLIECKASALRRDGKVGVDPAQYVAELQGTVQKGVEQLRRCESHLRSRPALLPEVPRDRPFRSVLILLDTPWFGNSVMRRAVERASPSAAGAAPWHVLAIDELELLFGALKSGGLSELLAWKELDSERMDSDLRNILLEREMVAVDYQNPVLRAVHRRYLDAPVRSDRRARHRRR